MNRFWTAVHWLELIIGAIGCLFALSGSMADRSLFWVEFDAQFGAWVYGFMFANGASWLLSPSRPNSGKGARRRKEAA